MLEQHSRYQCESRGEYETENGLPSLVVRFGNNVFVGLDQEGFLISMLTFQGIRRQSHDHGEDDLDLEAYNQQKVLEWLTGCFTRARPSSELSL